jgi:hypothetical protein
MKRSVLACIGLLVAGCAQPFNADENLARTELFQIAPLGSDAREAMPKLENMGFKCSWQIQKPFAGVNGKTDYLYCDRSKMIGVLISRRWQLALIHHDYAVTDAKFGIALTGL